MANAAPKTEALMATRGCCIRDSMVDDYEPHALKKRGMSFTQNAVNFNQVNYCAFVGGYSRNRCKPARREPSSLKQKKALGPDDRAIPPACCPPGIIEIGRAGGDREFRREFFVNLDAQAGLLLRQHIAVLDFGTAHKYFLRLLREAAALVDTEVVAR